MVQTRRSKALGLNGDAEPSSSSPITPKDDAKRRKADDTSTLASPVFEISADESHEADKLPLRGKEGGVHITFPDDDWVPPTALIAGKTLEANNGREDEEIRTPAGVARILTTSAVATDDAEELTTPTPSKQILAEATFQIAAPVQETNGTPTTPINKKAAVSNQEEDDSDDSDAAPEAITQSSAKALLKAASRTQKEAITSSSALEKSKRKAKAEKLQLQAQETLKRKEKKEWKEEKKRRKAEATTPSDDKEDASAALDPNNLPAFLPDSILEAAAAAESSRLLNPLPKPTKRKFTDEVEASHQQSLSQKNKKKKKILLPYEKQAALAQRVVKKGSVLVRVLDAKGNHGGISSTGNELSGIAPKMAKGGALQARKSWLMGRGAVSRGPASSGFVRR